MLSIHRRLFGIIVLLVVMVLTSGSLEASKAGGVRRSTSMAISLSTIGYLNRASVSGALLAWDGLGTSDALLSSSDVERLDVSLSREGEKPVSLKIDGRGRFSSGTVAPGVYYLNVAFDGRKIHSHKIELSAMDNVSLEVGFRHSSAGADIYVRGFGAASSSVDVVDSGERFLVDYLSTGTEVSEIDGDDAVFDELDAPVELFRYRSGNVSSDQTAKGWAEEDVPSSMPSFGSGTIIIDPDVNVSQLHKSLSKCATSLDLTAI